MQFNLSYLSKYRTELMGIAALMVISIHAVDYGVAMPTILSKVMGYGWLGVDLFLFLSGIGIYYSLSKKHTLKGWYKKRLIRIFVPYTLIQIPFWSYRLITHEFDLKSELLNFSTINFWLEHSGAWYVALLFPLYLLAPGFRLFLTRGVKSGTYWQR